MRVNWAVLTGPAATTRDAINLLGVAPIAGFETGAFDNVNAGLYPPCV